MMDTTKSALKAIADGGEKKGLFKFFHKESEKERELRMRREREETDLWQQQMADEAIARTRREIAAKEKERFDAKMRKRKSRNKIYERERDEGLRDDNLRRKRQRVSRGND
jgi:hypothetical protein